VVLPAIDFDVIKDLVQLVVLRLQNPVSSFDVVFVESDDVIEVSVSREGEGIPLCLLAIDGTKVRVIRSSTFDPSSFVDVSYQGYLDLFGTLVQVLYPFYMKSAKNDPSVCGMLSILLGRRIRIWKDFVSEICKENDVEVLDLGGSFRVSDVTVRYDGALRKLVFTGGYRDSVKVGSVLDFVVVLCKVLDFIGLREGKTINPMGELGEAEDMGVGGEQMPSDEDIVGGGMGSGMGGEGVMFGGPMDATAAIDAGGAVNTAPPPEVSGEDLQAEFNGGVM